MNIDNACIMFSRQKFRYNDMPFNDGHVLLEKAIGHFRSQIDEDIVYNEVLGAVNITDHWRP